MRDSFCSYCGQPFAATAVYPKRCDHCGNWVYHNPPPVGVAILPVNHGLMTVRRNIDPGRGELALPSGYVEFGETVERCVARELKEETGVTIDPNSITLTASRVSEQSGALLVFGLCQSIWLPEPLHFELDANARIETQEVVIIDRPVTSCFSHHTAMIAHYFESRHAPTILPPPSR